MKINIILLVLLLSTSLTTTAQLDLSTNLGDLSSVGPSVYLEKGIGKRSGIEFGLISRQFQQTIIEFPDDWSKHWIYHDYSSYGVITRIDYKLYFSKSKYNHEGWYFSIFNRNEFIYHFEKGYKEKYREINGDDKYFDHPVQSIEVGGTVGIKKELNHNLLFFTSIGYSLELLQDFFGFTESTIRGLSMNPVGALGVGYRFPAK